MPNDDVAPFVTRRTLGSCTPAGKPCCLHYLDQYVTIYAGGEDTRGAYGLLTGEFPQYAGPPPHVHSLEDEAFLVVSGHLHCWVDGHFEDVPAGSFIFLPKGLTHWFQAVSEEMTKVVCIVSPGGHEDMFRRIGTPADSLEMPPPLRDYPAKKVIEEANASGVAVNPTHADWVAYQQQLAEARMKGLEIPLFLAFWRNSQQ
jgi:quercetin dioxygenase-like cupin family protein